MRYQLVLQWPSTVPKNDFDQLIEIEDVLIERLTEQNTVDGHDIGSGEMNVFILTDDPQSSFVEITALLEPHKMWSSMRAAYREIQDDQYTVLWPHHLTHFRLL
jgi:hypothetical protein